MTIGQPLPRPDGPAKVTGRARYTADHTARGMLHAALVTATIPAGRITAIEIDAALREPGVVRVLTHRDMPDLGGSAPGGKANGNGNGKHDVLTGPPSAQSFLPMQDDEIRHEGQPVAIVLGETLEAAEAGAQRVRVRYAAAEPRMPGPQSWSALVPAAVKPRDSGFLFGEVVFEKPATDGRPPAVRVEASYFQAARHHNQIEPAAVLARWDGDALTVHDSTQHVYGVRQVLAARFRMPLDRVRVIAHHTGGGFGGKGWVWPHEVLAAAAARIAGRPVRLVLRRADQYSCLGYQPRVAQHIALSADTTGRLLAIEHDAINTTSISDDYVEYATDASKGLYASSAIRLSQRVERAHVAMPTPMRAPVEGPGTWGLESAMDELAHTLGLDPLDLRLVNYAERDPATGQPWSSKQLRAAYEEGARRFGWRERPRGARDGAWRIGHGMATCTMGTFRTPSSAAIRLRADGTAVVETGTQDIGTGTLTIVPQIAADVLGLSIEHVAVVIGDTVLPEAGPSYGSSSAMGVGAAVLRAAEDVRRKLARLIGLPPDGVEMAGGRIRRTGSGAGVAITDAMRGAGVSEIAGAGRFDPEQHGKGHAMRVFGAVFVEVGVDLELGLLRLRRAVGAYSAGRILNPRTARSQLIGGIIWGWGMAALEHSPLDPRLGRFVSKDLAGVALPVNADIPADIAVHFVDEIDELASPIGGRGIGELGATGVAAAVANAVFAATGLRIRELPITPAALVAAR
ncbi:MAG TPA: xanthine dehydrogenase family protein molybdopterin-binding subunit [Kofleriaceae bacterium]|jgi:xanthine dehydrogenase YagR molybdenum-binding subunit|nr:xanthine dehydrogenase family protein molybdopterin-binding subunit [Kofleriaceae bacterium]